jgi:type I restriction enzyme S subunit
MSFPRYPRYRDSGVEWLGLVPDHWEIVPVKRCLRSITQGWSPQCEGYPADGQQWGVLKVGCVNGGKFDPSENKALPDDLQPIPALSIRKGDVLISRANTRELVGSVAVVERDYERLLLCDKLYRLRVDSQHCAAAFLASSLSTSAARCVIEAVASGASSSMLNIGQAAITGMIIALPPVKEQQAVLDFLDCETAKIDTLVEEQKRLIELLKEKRQAVISQAVTKGMDPNVPMKDSGVEWLGQVPAHWRLARLKFVAHVQTGVAKGKDNSGKVTVEVPYLRVANVQDGYLDLDDVATIEIPADDLPRYCLRAGDVLMNEGGDFDKLGRGHVWDGSIDPCIHQNHVFAVRPLGVSPQWLNAVTSSNYAQFYFMSRSKQSTNLASISSTNLMDLPVIIPPADEQEVILNAIDSQCATFDQMIVSGQGAIQLLQERRSALISAAVTGKIDVRGGDVTAAWAEATADIAAGRFVVESSQAHLARIRAMTRRDG